MNGDPTNPRDDDAPDDLPDRVEDLPAWREPPKAPEIPDVLRRPVARPRGMPATPVDRTTSDSMKAAGAWAIALNFVYAVIAFAFIGWAVQRWLAPSWAPWPLLVGLGLGLIGGFIRFVREALKANR